MPGGIPPPVEVILSWPVPNYDDPVTRPKLMPVLAGILGFFTLALFLARLWVRISVQRNAGLDDWLMVAAMPFVIGLTVIFPVASEMYGFDRHVWDIQPKMFSTQRKLLLTIEVAFSFVSGLIKVSILLFYRRLTDRVVSTPFRWATWISIFFISTTSLTFTLIPLLGCRPISAFYDSRILDGKKFKCFNEGLDITVAAIFSAVQDLLTTTLPMVLYWNLRIPVRQKIALFSVFAIGYLIVVVASVRAYYSWYVFFATYDVTWTAWTCILTSLIELHIGCMCANAPAFKVFWGVYLSTDKLASRLKSKSASKAASTSSTTGLNAGSAINSTFCGMALGPRQKNGYLAEPHVDLLVHQSSATARPKNSYDTSWTDSMYDSHHSSKSNHDIETMPHPCQNRIRPTQVDSEHHPNVQALPRFHSPSFPMNAIPHSATPERGRSVASLPSSRSAGRMWC